jgi:cytochrome d ubiquinol oxidase subunit II
MAEVWFGILVAMLAMLAVLDGWNIGAGLLQRVVARTDAERRQVITALGPLWSWHEVWLIAAGGVCLLAFPRALAVAFSGFYLPLWFLLWALVLRGIAIEVGGHLDDRLWRGFWDVVLSLASAALALLLGLTLGNLLRGVPLDATRRFRAPLFTDFRATGDLGVIDWFTLASAVVTVVVLAAHGATYLQLKTSGPVHARSRRAAGWLWAAALLLQAPLLVALGTVRPSLLTAAMASPGPWLGAAIVAAGAAAVWSGHHGGHERRALIGSSAVIAGALATIAAAQFPVMLASAHDAAWSLTVHGAASADAGLRTALLWWPPAAAAAVGYAVVVARSFRGKV